MRIKGTTLYVSKGREHRSWRSQERGEPSVPGIWIEDRDTAESVFITNDQIAILMREMLNTAFGTRG